MLKSALATALLAALVGLNSGCCCLSNWYYQGTAVGTDCGSCGQGGCFGGYCNLFGRYGHVGSGCTSGGCGDVGCDSCDSAPITRSACGGGHGCFGMFDMFGWGCGKTYWGDWHAGSHCEPCDDHGNYVGPGYYPPGPTLAPDMPIDGEVVLPYEVSVTPAKTKNQPTPARVARQPRRAH